MSDIGILKKDKVSTPTTDNNCKNKSCSSPTNLSSQFETEVSQDVICTPKLH